MRWGAWIVVVAGCTSVFGLDSVSDSDRDSDRVSNPHDNCPDVANPDQSNIDGDELGDACDECEVQTPDVDADGIPDPCDGCISAGVDRDNDEIPDNCDPCIGDEIGEDLDGDAIDDGCDTCVSNGIDEDLDMTPDNCDPCVGTIVPGPNGSFTCVTCSGGDADGDGVLDTCDPLTCVNGTNHDEDVDLLDDRCDPCPLHKGTTSDMDMDGVGDDCELKASGMTAAVFDSHATQMPSWFIVGPGWAYGPNDTLGLFVPDEESYRVIDVPPSQRFSVWTTFKLEQLAAGGTSSVDVLVADRSGSQTPGPTILCSFQVRQFGPAQQVNLVLDGSNVTQPQMATAIYNPTKSYLLAIHVTPDGPTTGASAFCEVNEAGATASSKIETLPSEVTLPANLHAGFGGARAIKITFGGFFTAYN